MRRRAAPDMKTALLGVGLGLLTAVVLFTGLSALARPTNLKARLARLETMADRAERARDAGGDPTLYPAGAICNGGAGPAADELRKRLETAAAANSVSLGKYMVVPQAEGAKLTPVLVQMEGTGAYDGVLHMLEAMGRGEPRVFVDTVDITPKVSVVDLKFSGRVLCWTSARP